MPVFVNCRGGVYGGGGCLGPIEGIPTSEGHVVYTGECPIGTTQAVVPEVPGDQRPHCHVDRCERDQQDQIAKVRSYSTRIRKPEVHSKHGFNSTDSDPLRSLLADPLRDPNRYDRADGLAAIRSVRLNIDLRSSQFPNLLKIF